MLLFLRTLFSFLILVSFFSTIFKKLLVVNNWIWCFQMLLSWLSVKLISRFLCLLLLIGSDLADFKKFLTFLNPLVCSLQQICIFRNQILYIRWLISISFTTLFLAFLDDLNLWFLTRLLICFNIDQVIGHLGLIFDRFFGWRLFLDNWLVEQILLKNLAELINSSCLTP